MLRLPRGRGRGLLSLRRIATVTLTCVTALVVTVCALYVADFDPLSVWRAWAKSSTVAPQAASPPKTAARNSVVQPMPVGSDSSISSVWRPLVLAATHPGKNLRDGHAQIGIDKISPQTYRVGALLANGARLAEIYSDHVLLERDGVHAELYTDGREQNRPDAALLAALLTVGRDKSRPAVASSRDALTETIRVSPKYSEDRVVGLEVYPSANSHAFYQSGLRDGDRIEAIDNRRVSDIDGAIGLLRRRITGERPLTLTVVRNGSLQTLSMSGNGPLASSSVGTSKGAAR